LFHDSPELTLYQRRLEEYSRHPSSNLRCFQSFFKHGASRKESLTLCKIREVIKKNLSQYTAELNNRLDAWQQYGEFNETTGSFDFCPYKFIQPLKDRLMVQIQFQEMMAHTVRSIFRYIYIVHCVENLPYISFLLVMLHLIIAIIRRVH